MTVSRAFSMGYETLVVRREAHLTQAKGHASRGRLSQPSRSISMWRRLLVCGRTWAGQRPCSTALAHASAQQDVAARSSS